MRWRPSARGASWFADADELIAAAAPEPATPGVTVLVKGSRVKRLERVAAALSAAGHDEPRAGRTDAARISPSGCTQFYSGFNVFGYLTLRAILAALTALAISLLVGPCDDPPARRSTRSASAVRDDGPQSAPVEGGHADDGRRADPGRDHRRDAAVGATWQPLRLDRARA